MYSLYRCGCCDDCLFNVQFVHDLGICIICTVNITQNTSNLFTCPVLSKYVILESPALCTDAKVNIHEHRGSQPEKRKCCVLFGAINNLNPILGQIFDENSLCTSSSQSYHFLL